MTSDQELTAKARLYRVECWEAEIPGDDRFKYRRGGIHHQFGVVCHSAVDALDFVRKTHPTYRIDSVNQAGFANYVLASALSSQSGQSL